MMTMVTSLIAVFAHQTGVTLCIGDRQVTFDEATINELILVDVHCVTKSSVQATLAIRHYAETLHT